MPSTSPVDSSGERADYSTSQQLDSLLDFGSKALNGIVANMGTPANDASGTPSHEPRSSPLASIASMLTGGGGEGGMCFKTCGMEDIQFAAVKAGELFISLRFCALVLTVITVFCMLTLTVAIGYCLLRNKVRVDDSRQSSPEVHLIGRTLSIFGAKSEKPPPPSKEINDSEKTTV